MEKYAICFIGLEVSPIYAPVTVCMLKLEFFRWLAVRKQFRCLWANRKIAGGFVACIKFSGRWQTAAALGSGLHADRDMITSIS